MMIAINQLPISDINARIFCDWRSQVKLITFSNFNIMMIAINQIARFEHEYTLFCDWRSQAQLIAIFKLTVRFLTVIAIMVLELIAIIIQGLSNQMYVWTRLVGWVYPINFLTNRGWFGHFYILGIKGQQ